MPVVALWDADTGRELAVLKGHMDTVTAVAWTPDGKALAPAETATAALGLCAGRMVLAHGDRARPASEFAEALVADARLAMERVPPTHALHRRLDGAISRLGGLRRDLGVTGFVKGLSRDHRADWERVAREARRRVQAFDEDVEATTVVEDMDGLARAVADRLAEVAE